MLSLFLLLRSDKVSLFDIVRWFGLLFFRTDFHQIQLRLLSFVNSVYLFVCLLVAIANGKTRARVECRQMERNEANKRRSAEVEQDKLDKCGAAFSGAQFEFQVFLSANRMLVASTGAETNASTL